MLSEVQTRIYCFRVHHGQITSNQMLLPVIDRLRKVTVEKVTSLRVSSFPFFHPALQLNGVFRKIYTPQPHYNTIVGVHSINRVS